MCGICGTWDLSGHPVDPELLHAMRETVAHRGPDDASAIMFDSRGGTTTGPYRDVRPPHDDGRDVLDVGFGHRRLAIIDLASGDQPMASSDGSAWITYNGEVYNYRELRADLVRAGHAFRTECDTEVVLEAYLEHGEDCAKYLNGIFAFAIWDVRKRSMFLARDHYGIKPLYYCLQGRRFYFSSEVKAILADPRVRRELDVDALNMCLTFRHTPSPWTLFAGIRKLEPGQSMTVTADGITTRRFFEGPDPVDRSIGEDEWVDRLRAELDEAVERQMVADVPIGLSLSSGVDSTAMLALMSAHSSAPIQAFTVGFGGKEDTSEIEPARAAAARFGADFHSQVIEASDYEGFMNRYMWHLEEPMGNESAAAYYFVARMAQQLKIKVLLNGQGADEAFAGYQRYVSAAYGRWLRWGAVPPLKWLVPKVTGGSALGERYQRMLPTVGAADEADRFLRTYSIATPETLGRLIGGDVWRAVDRDLPLRYTREQLARAPQGTPLERMTYVDARTSLPDNLLLCEDKMAMAASVEARVPILDLELMDVAERIPGSFKLRRLKNKYVHRKAVSKWVGDEVAARPQIGFDNAMDLWLRNQLHDRLSAIIRTPDSFSANYLDPGAVGAMLDEHLSGRRDHQRMLFLVLSLESWHSVFFQEDERVAEPAAQR
jgi:asparagine synthase (glutamine-hydrolysing)